MSTPTAVSAYVSTLALLALLGLILVWQKQKSGKTITVWLASALCGIVLGAAGSYAALNVSGYQVVSLPKWQDFPAMPEGGQGMPMSGGSGMGPGGGGMGMGGPSGGMGMGGGGFGQPQPKRDLTTLVRKVVLLTGDVKLDVSADQAGQLVGLLKDVESRESMTDDDAKALHDEILALFSEEQAAKLDTIRPAGRRGGAGGGSGGGGEQNPDANPFEQGENSEAVDTLRQRFGGAAEPAERNASADDSQ